MNRAVLALAWPCLWTLASAGWAEQVPPPPEPGLGAPAPAAEAEADPGPVKPLTEGPLHEAFLSPLKSADPDYVVQAPPAPIVERPGVDPPDVRAQWIEGYWGWEAGRNDFVWVTGTWRVPPPGRFWVNGYWKRDDQGWYRVPGFWSDRKTDRIDFRKDGPPTNRPAEEPGESPGPGHFYVPGQYYPDGDGVVWKPGFWTKSQEGWAWVPSQWVRQPEGWTFQEGFWDRQLEDRGILFAPAEVAQDARNAGTTFSPYTRVGSESFGLLNGAFGRPNADYDGYPGCYYDPTGRYYGYAGYGSLGSYYGYLDYPYYGTIGYPYLTSSVGVGVGGYGLGYGGLGYGGLGYGLVGGALGGLCGFGLGGFGYPYYGYGGGFGFPYQGYGGGFGLGYSSFGYGGFGSPYCSTGFGGLGLGLGFGTGLGLGLLTSGWGGGGWGSGFGPYYGGGGRNAHRNPFYPGRQVNSLVVHGNHNNIAFAPNARSVGPGQGGLGRGGPGGLVTGGGAAFRPLGNRVSPPPSSRPFANPFLRQTTDLHRGGSLVARGQPRVQGPGGRVGSMSGTGLSAIGNRGGQAALPRPRVADGAIRGGWAPSFNGNNNLQAARVPRSAARPTFTTPHTVRPGQGAVQGNFSAGVNGSNTLPRIDRGNLIGQGGSNRVVTGQPLRGGSLGNLPGGNLGNPSMALPRGPGGRVNASPNLGQAIARPNPGGLGGGGGSTSSPYILRGAPSGFTGGRSLPNVGNPGASSLPRGGAVGIPSMPRGGQIGPSGGGFSAMPRGGSGMSSLGGGFSSMPRGGGGMGSFGGGGGMSGPRMGGGMPSGGGFRGGSLGGMGGGGGGGGMRGGSMGGGGMRGGASGGRR